MSPVLKAMQVSNNGYRSIAKSMDAEGYPPKQCAVYSFMCWSCVPSVKLKVWGERRQNFIFQVI